MEIQQLHRVRKTWHELRQRVQDLRNLRWTNQVDEEFNRPTTQNTSR